MKTFSFEPLLMETSLWKIVIFIHFSPERNKLQKKIAKYQKISHRKGKLSKPNDLNTADVDFLSLLSVWPMSFLPTTATVPWGQGRWCYCILRVPHEWSKYKLLLITESLWRSIAVVGCNYSLRKCQGTEGQLVPLSLSHLGLQLSWFCHILYLLLSLFL